MPNGNIQRLFCLIIIVLSAAITSQLIGEEVPAELACEVRDKGLAERTLSEAVDEFNKLAAKNYVGKHQPPLQTQSVVERALEELDNDSVPAAAKELLRDVVDSRRLPSTAYFRHYTRYDDGQKVRGVWWVRLVLQPKGKPIYSLPIRSIDLFQRPYTQMERRQHASGGLTLINRFSSFYAQVPQKNDSIDLPQAAIEQLKDEFTATFEAKDVDRALKLFLWRRTTKATRDFVKGELAELFQSKLIRVGVCSQSLSGRLRHWSAFQNYKPNMPISGFLDIVYVAPDDPWGLLKTLTLEAGLSGKRLWLVNYITDGELNLPKRAMAGMGMRGTMEPMANGKFQTTTIVDNPGTLISGHIANQEIWLRDGNSEQEEMTDRLKSLFQKLNREPLLQPSSHARDLPDLYQPIADQPGHYEPVEGILLLKLNRGIPKTNDMESIWIRYRANQNRFYIQHRLHLDDPHHDRCFGPYSGNPLELLPEIEQSLLNDVRNGDSNAFNRLSRMMKPKDPDLASRVIEIVEKAMTTKLDTYEKAMRFRRFDQIIEQGREACEKVADQTTLTRVRNKLSAFRTELDELRMTVPPGQYSSAKAWGQKHPEHQVDSAKIADEDWGEPVRGLRLALVFDRKAIELKDSVRVWSVLQNVSKEPIRFSVQEGGTLPHPRVTHKGRYLPSYRVEPPLLLEPNWLRFVLDPGETIGLGHASFRFCEKVESNELAVPPLHFVWDLEDSVLKSDEKINVAFSKQFGGWDQWGRNDQEQRAILAPAKGEYRGTIHAAEIQLRLK